MDDQIGKLIYEDLQIISHVLSKGFLWVASHAHCCSLEFFIY